MATIRNLNKEQRFSLCLLANCKPLLPIRLLMIIATYDANGHAKAMNAAWGGIVGMDEILIDLGSHQTTDNIRLNKAFPVSVADTEHLTACDYVGIVSAKQEMNKMAKAGFTVTESAFVHAPIINELPLALECELIKVLEGSMYLGKIVNVSVDEKILGTDGEISLDKCHPVIYDTVRHGYYQLGEKVGNAFHDGKKLASN